MSPAQVQALRVLARSRRWVDLKDAKISIHTTRSLQVLGFVKHRFVDERVEARITAAGVIALSSNDPSR